MGLKISYGDELQDLISNLDSIWENQVIENLPFPIAYSLNRLQKSNYDWGLLLKETLNSILRYLALLAINEYLQSPQEPDYDLNERIKGRITGRTSEGIWLELYRTCVLKVGIELKIPELLSAFEKLEKDATFKVSVNYPKYDKQQYGGLFSTLIFLRNRDVHGPFLDEKEKQEASSILLGLLRTVIYHLEPVFEHEYYQQIKGRREGIYRLQGLKDFARIERPDEMPDEAENFLKAPESEKIELYLFPLTLVESEKGCLGNLGEVYLLNMLRKGAPEYEGLKLGMRSKREYLKQVLSHFDLKRVFDRRQDIELEGIEQYAFRKSSEKLEFYKEQKLYDPGHYVCRRSLEGKLESFLDSDKSIFLLFGESGCGKTATLYHFADEQLKRQNNALIFRCEALAPVLANPNKLEELILAELGYDGKFTDILEYLQRKGKQFVIIFDGLNEFSWIADRTDSSHLFVALNQLFSLLGNYPTFKAIISTRPEDQSYMLKEDGSFYSFVPYEKYYQDHDTRKSFVILDDFSEEEITEAIDVFCLQEDEAKVVFRDKKRKLHNPFLLRLFSENVAFGLSIRNVRKKRIIRDNVKIKIQKRKEILSILDKLILTMDKLKDMNPSLEKLESKAPVLYKKMTENNWEILHLLEQNGMLKIQDIYGEKGIPSKVISYNHDGIFDYVKSRQTKNAILNFSFITIGANLILVLLLFLSSFTIDRQISEIDNIVINGINKIETHSELTFQEKKDFKILIEQIYAISKELTQIMKMTISRLVLNLMFLLTFLLVILFAGVYFYKSIIFKDLDTRIIYLRNKFEENFSRKVGFFALFALAVFSILAFLLKLQIKIIIPSMFVFVLLGIVICFRYMHKKVIDLSSFKLYKSLSEKATLKSAVLFLMYLVILICAVYFGCFIGASTSEFAYTNFEMKYEKLADIINAPKSSILLEGLVDKGFIEEMPTLEWLGNIIADGKRVSKRFRGTILKIGLLAVIFVWFYIAFFTFGYEYYLRKRLQYFEKLFSKQGVVV